MELVTIKTFDNLTEAHLIKARLESENITCFLFDEHVVGLNPLFSVTIGGIKLKVNQFDLEKATKILEASVKSTLTDAQGEVVKCPKCKSVDIYSGFRSMKETKGILSAMVSFLFMVFPIYYRTVYRCKSCEHEFK